jgi:UDP-N-acetyl-2-amino-2-deoxyglucuronate dehydrogenase
MVRGVGIVGTGVVFAEHAAALGMLDGRLRLVGIAEVDEHRRRAATETCFVPYATNDHRELVERPDVDIVVVCTPPSAHEAVIVDALAAGKHVVCEKPLAGDLEAVDRVVELARSAPGRLSTVYQWRFRPEVRRMVHLVEEGRLGRLLLGHFQRFARLPGGHDVGGWWGRWDRAGGGAVMTQAIHEIDLMLHLFGDVTSVHAEIATLGLPIESEDSATAVVHFASGALGMLTVSVATHDASTRFDVVGEDAGVHLPWRITARDERVRRQLLAEALAVAPGPGRLAHPEIVRARNKLRRLSPRLGPPAAPPLHLGYWRAVADALDAGEPLPVGPVEARRSVELVTAIYTSALEERTVSLPLAPDATYAGGVTTEVYARRSPVAR